MTAYKQFANTAYDGYNSSIIDVQPIGDPELMFLNASDYMTIFQKVLIPTNSSSQADNHSIDALLYSIAWLHRTYLGSLPYDQNSVLTNLQNFISIPIQFTVTAYEFVNYTTNLNFSMPSDTMTTATNG